MLPSPLHPAIVHFPIVLTVLAPVVVAAALVAIRRGASAFRAWSIPTAVFAALVLSAWMATLTGEREEDRVERVVAEQPIESHEEAAELFLYSAVAVLAVSLVGLVGGAPGRTGRAVTAVGALALVAAGWNVGHSGGELVYRHGAARAYMDGGAPPSRGEDEASVQLREARDHYAQVMPLIRNLHNGLAATEMAATADHVERALRSGARLRGHQRPGALREVRGTAALLARQETGVPSSTGPALEALQVLLDSLTPPAASPDSAARASR